MNFMNELYYSVNKHIAECYGPVMPQGITRAVEMRQAVPCDACDNTITFYIQVTDTVED